MHRALQSKKIDHLDFISLTKTEFGLDAVEYVNSFFFDKAQDQKYLSEMNTRANDHDVKSLLIMCDNEGNLCLLYTSPSPRDGLLSRMPSSA